MSHFPQAPPPGAYVPPNDQQPQYSQQQQQQMSPSTYQPNAMNPTNTPNYGYQNTTQKQSSTAAFGKMFDQAVASGKPMFNKFGKTISSKLGNKPMGQGTPQHLQNYQNYQNHQQQQNPQQSQTFGAQTQQPQQQQWGQQTPQSTYGTPQQSPYPASNYGTPASANSGQSNYFPQTNQPMNQQVPQPQSQPTESGYNPTQYTQESVGNIPGQQAQGTGYDGQYNQAQSQPQGQTQGQAQFQQNPPQYAPSPDQQSGVVGTSMSPISSPPPPASQANLPQSFGQPSVPNPQHQWNPQAPTVGGASFDGTVSSPTVSQVQAFNPTPPPPQYGGTGSAAVQTIDHQPQPQIQQQQPQSQQYPQQQPNQSHQYGLPSSNPDQTYHQETQQALQQQPPTQDQRPPEQHQQPWEATPPVAPHSHTPSQSVPPMTPPPQTTGQSPAPPTDNAHKPVTDRPPTEFVAELPADLGNLSLLENAKPQSPSYQAYQPPSSNGRQSSSPANRFSVPRRAVSTSSLPLADPWRVADTATELPTREFYIIADVVFDVLDRKFEPQGTGLLEASKILQSWRMQGEIVDAAAQLFEYNTYSAFSRIWSLRNIPHILVPCQPSLMPSFNFQQQTHSQEMAVPSALNGTPYPTYMPALNRAGWYKYLFQESLLEPQHLDKLLTSFCAESYKPGVLNQPDLQRLDRNQSPALVARASALRQAVNQVCQEIAAEMHVKQAGSASPPPAPQPHATFHNPQ
ncbi:hypothetical protein BU24DRAFT_466268 [Aaosphaeria arxii CBS 175.79]|uniref:Uncharacterized protein n=1 Tax=Aaosphaeria arxii CBS 175.79 TaxID=1450172 RepID=A0A6A5XEE7_9PLEO|nr:uncharacterized protein BU24DRAFT_466268 [Aaosphaeria arxii CBS 175.79]KAF2011575.1 hypothetical protein BU24DRAFT_466268 [Aaosphaeria arxii CBS 175.79]